MTLDFKDPEVREDLARQAYYRERADEAARDREHDLEASTEFFVLSWESLDDWARQPYRTAVATALDAVEAALTS